jgi:hypothetical protein
MLSSLELAIFTPQGAYNQLKAEAKQVGIETMYALCKEANVNYTTVNKWKLAQSEPTFSIIGKLLIPIKIRKSIIQEAIVCSGLPR